MKRRRSGIAFGLVLLASCVPRAEVAVPAEPPHVAPPPPQSPLAPARSPVDPARHAALRKAAADHTNAARALVEQADAMTDGPERRPVLLRAVNEYGLAARAWTALFTQEPQAADAAEARYWIADAWDRMLALEHEAGGTPSTGELVSARRAVVSARDTNVGIYGESAAFMLVEVATLALSVAQERYKRTGGAEGVEERLEIRTTGEGEGARVVQDPLPREVEDAIAARDAYIERVPRADDTYDNRTLYAYQAAELDFLYGHLDEARRRLLPISDPTKCGYREYGYRAWSLLVDIAKLEHDAAESRALADAWIPKGCTPEGDEPRIWVERIPAVVVATRKAEAAAPGPERDRLWKTVAEDYDAKLRRAPDSREAPEYAVNGAHAYKQIGAFGEAVAMYRLFLQTYGSKASLARVEKGDPRATPPLLPDPRAYQERLKYTKMVADALATAAVLGFDYEPAAEAFEALARNTRFDPKDRRDAANNATVLHASSGNLDRARAMRDLLAGLHPPLARLAELDWVLAHASVAAWDEHAPDGGANRVARLSALASMRSWRARYGGKGTAALEVRAAYETARLLRAGGDPGADGACRDAVRAFDAARTSPPGRGGALAPAEVDMAAECAFGAIDERLRADFDYGTGHHHYRGRTFEVERTYYADLDKAERFVAELQDVIARFASPRWTSVVKARQASAYDSCRTGLYDARPPALKLNPPGEDHYLRYGPLVIGGDPVAAAIGWRERERGEQWRVARERALDRADSTMIKLYTEAVLIARAHGVHDPAVDVAIRRLTFFTGVLGDARIRELTRGLTDPSTKAPFEYSDGLFVRMRPGMALQHEPDTFPAPLPATP